MKRGKALASAESRPEDRSSAIGGRLLATGGYDGKVPAVWGSGSWAMGSVHKS